MAGVKQKGDSVMDRKFRRPAMLDPEQAEEIIGDEDPSVESDMAHATAWALMGVPAGGFSQEDVDKAVAAVREQGADIVAAFWTRSPEFTLPGAFWRIYLLWQWHELNPEVVTQRYDEGVQAMEARGVANEESVPSLQDTLKAVQGVLFGYATEEDLAPVFEAVAQVMRVMAAGVRFGPEWVTSDNHQLAHPVTRRPGALLETANELDQSALDARAGSLE